MLPDKPEAHSAGAPLRQAVGVGLLSFALLALQIAIMQGLAHAQGHHLAYIVISIALLGFGASGSFLHVWRAGAGRPLEPLFLPSLLLCALSTAWLLPASRPLVAGIEIDLMEVDRSQWLRLGTTGMLMFLPFFFGASALAIAFTTRVRSVGYLYGANLLGSAAGAAGALGLLATAFPETLIPALAFCPLAAAVLAPESRRGLLFLSLVVVTVAGILAAFAVPREIPLSPYKGLSYALQMPDAQRSKPYPHPRGRFETVQSPALRYAPDLSLSFTGEVPAPATVFINGETYGHLLAPDGPEADILAQTPRALPFALQPARNAVLLAPGGTAMANLALSKDSLVTAVEPHPHVAQAITTLLASQGVRVVHQDPRTFLSAKMNPPPDLIVFPERGIFGGPVGLQALGEDFLFTVEAVAQAHARLSPEGFLAFNVWLDEPLRHSPRTIDLAAKALRKQGIEDPQHYFAVVRGWGSLSVAVSASPLQGSDFDALQAFADDFGFDVIWPEHARLPERMHGGEDGTLEQLFSAILRSGRPEVLEAYRLDIAAPTDNRPFFNQFLKIADGLPPFIRSDDDFQALTVSERGLVFIIELVVVLAVASAVLILGPLLLVRTSLSTARFTLLYFAGLGVGFMFFEIALIQRFTLLWGSPIYSAAGVIGIVLCGMGIGSTLSQKFEPSPRRLALLATVIALLQGIILLALSMATEALVGGGHALRVLAGLLFLMPPAILLGMPFPLGLRLLARTASASVPWAWGVNGCLSVLSAPAAGLLAFAAGFDSLLFVAAAAYLLAAVAALTALASPDDRQ